MSQSKRFGPVEAELLQQISDPEYLSARVPGISDVLEGADMMRALQSEIRARSRLEDINAVHVAKINMAFMLMLENVHNAGCTCQEGLWGPRGHKQWFFDWLKQFGEAYDTSEKVKV
jgi:hypothetical protein